MGLPPFRGAVRQIVLVCIIFYVFLLVLAAFAPALSAAVSEIGILEPNHVRHGWIWQFITYPFMAGDPWQFAVSLAGVYFLGATVEDRIGSGRFWGLFLGSSVLAGLAGFTLSLTGVIAQGPALTVGAATNAILMVFYLFNRDVPIMAFFILRIPVKWLVVFFAALETAYLLIYHFALFYFVLLFGLAAGYVWYKLFLTRRTTTGISEKYFGLRNQYYRWKRRRAARKFEVYMRDHDRTVQFDEHGNYIPPDDSGKKNGGSKSGWVN